MPGFHRVPYAGWMSGDGIASAGIEWCRTVPRIRDIPRQQYREWRRYKPETVVFSVTSLSG